VLDPFAGSGSMPSAALRLGRRPACMEVEPEWAERVTHRLRETAAQVASAR
jgi:site-specific DNA-methyltransferase (adenine-specific)